MLRSCVLSLLAPNRFAQSLPAPVGFTAMVAVLSGAVSAATSLVLGTSDLTVATSVSSLLFEILVSFVAIACFWFVLRLCAGAAPFLWPTAAASLMPSLVLGPATTVLGLPPAPFPIVYGVTTVWSAAIVYVCLRRAAPERALFASFAWVTSAILLWVAVAPIAV